MQRNIFKIYPENYKKKNPFQKVLDKNLRSKTKKLLFDIRKEDIDCPKLYRMLWKNDYRINHPMDKIAFR